MVKHKLTKEPDLFLGEKVIEVRRVGAPRDVWYKLGKLIVDRLLCSLLKHHGMHAYKQCKYIRMYCGMCCPVFQLYDMFSCTRK